MLHISGSHAASQATPPRPITRLYVHISIFTGHFMDSTVLAWAFSVQGAGCHTVRARPFKGSFLFKALPNRYWRSHACMCTSVWPCSVSVYCMSQRQTPTGVQYALRYSNGGSARDTTHIRSALQGFRCCALCWPCEAVTCVCVPVCGHSSQQKRTIHNRSSHS